MTPVLSVKQRKKNIRKTPLFRVNTLTADITAKAPQQPAIIFCTLECLVAAAQPTAINMYPERKKQKSIVIFDKLTDEEKAARAAQYDALNMRLDQYEIQRRHSKERKN